MDEMDGVDDDLGGRQMRGGKRIMWKTTQPTRYSFFLFEILFKRMTGVDEDFLRVLKANVGGGTTAED
jgi:hypothetical protein